MTRHTRRKLLKAGGTAVGLLSVGGVGTASARDPPAGVPGGRKRGASAEQTITEIAAGDDRFSILVAALQETELDTVLDSDSGQYTVFAPTDAAFQALLDALGATPAELLNRPDLANILLYHVTNGRRYAASVVRAPRIQMLNGDPVTVDGTSLDDGQATITATDIEAANGVVHVIDGVLLP